jgi:hypothetical protein
VDTTIAAISAALSLAAIVVSIVVARRQTAIARQQTAIQARLAAIEEARRTEEVEARGRAWVTASFQPNPGQEASFVLVNEGPAVARWVTVQVDGIDKDVLPTILGLYDVLPLTLQPGQRMPFVAASHFQQAEAIRATIRWKDDAGQHEESFILRTP